MSKAQACGTCGSFCCSAPKCATGNRADISLPATGLARNCQSAQLLGIAAGAAGTISVRANPKSLAPVSSRGHTARGGSCDGAQPGHARRQIRPRQEPDLLL